MDERLISKFTAYKSLDIRNAELKTWIVKSNLWNWTYTILKFEGINVSKPAITDMLEGNLRDDVPLTCYGFMENYKDMHKDMQSEIEMKSSPDLRLFRRWSDMLEIGSARRSNSPVFELGLIPPHFNEIDSALDEAFKKYVNSDSDPVLAAEILCLDLIRVWPYADRNYSIALAVLDYCFSAMGLPLPELEISRADFVRLISRYMDRADGSGFCELVDNALVKRLDALISIAEKAEKNENKA